MTTTAQIDAFLACKRIGFAGVSTNPQDFSRTIFREFVARGYEVVPIHPTAKMIEGRPVFHSVRDAAPLDGVFIMTPPEATESIVEDCHRSGVKRVWMHRGVGGGSVEWHAVQYANAFGIDVVEGECPMMFFKDASRVHRAHACLRRATGHHPMVAAVSLGPPSLPHPHLRAIGYGVVAWMLATWLMLIAGGLFDWKVALVARYLALPASLGLLAWIHATPDRLPPLKAAMWFVAVGVVLDALVLVKLLAISPPWLLPYALGFAAATWLGTRHTRAFTAPRLAFARG